MSRTALAQQKKIAADLKKEAEKKRRIERINLAIIAGGTVLFFLVVNYLSSLGY